MDTNISSFLETHFDFFNLGSSSVGFLFPGMSLFFAYFFSLFAFIKQGFFRLKEKLKPQNSKLSSEVLIQAHEEEEEMEKEVRDVSMIEEKLEQEEEKMESFLSFRFQTYDEFVAKNVENRNEEDTSHPNNRVSDDENSDDESVEFESDKEDYETLIANSADNSLHVEDTDHGNNSVFVEEPQVSYVNVEENEDHVVCDLGQNLEEENVKIEEKLSDPVKGLGKNVYMFSSDDDESLVSDSDSDSLVSSSKFSFRSSAIDSMSDGFLSDIDFERAFEVGTTVESEGEKDIELENLNKGYETDDFEGEDEEILKELKNLESEDEKQEQTTTTNVNPDDEAEQKDEKPNSGEELSPDENELEREWEHQDFIEQLKMEIKNVRSIGLPTIFEESETLKITEDLKPWKIEEKFRHEDTLDELHKFYKGYRERMRKLDILNYQKMYAIGFLHLKEPLDSFAGNKVSNPSMAAIVSSDWWSCTGKSGTEVEHPVKMKKLRRELESDLETVYVGQMCLSWEFLRWEYGKALKLWDSDLRGNRRYNEVADKFQQFQVLITRFLEDEPFQGPRVPHYAKTRCVLKNLLQVPLIQEDDLRDNKKKERKWASGKDAVTSVKLVEIIEESIRIMWQFIRSDKSTSNALLLVKACGRSLVELQNPADAVLLEQLRLALQKKEKRLKELTRSESCILKRIRKRKYVEDGTGGDHARYFFAEVDLRLVCRVLNMSKISSEQFGWCNDKLNKINVVSGKLDVESSFLLFP